MCFVLLRITVLLMHFIVYALLFSTSMFDISV